jgi:hypothetical protein
MTTVTGNHYSTKSVKGLINVIELQNFYKIVKFPVYALVTSIFNAAVDAGRCMNSRGRGRLLKEGYKIRQTVGSGARGICQSDKLRSF